MNASELFDRAVAASMKMGLPIVQCYHLICGSVFLNTAAEDAQGLEKIGNYLLTPVQYCLAGHNAVKLDERTVAEFNSNELTYKIVQKFEYSEHFVIKTVASVAALPFSLIVGSAIKGMAYIFPDTRARHSAIVSSINSTKVHLMNDYYQSLGLNIGDLKPSEKIGPPGHKRRPGDENALKCEKEALRDIAQILTEKGIAYWLECGTCLGAYRYGGAIPWDNDIDIGVLAPDFDNVRKALNQLDKNKYAVQDWSGRNLPGTYLKVYVKESASLIDIYHYALDSENKTLIYILSNEENPFLPELWKIRERRYTTPVAYDVIFPLKKADFDGLEVLVPNKTKEYLQVRYGQNIEPVKIFNEATAQYEKDLSHPYWERAHVH